MISVVARVLEMHPQTLRKYERAGLLRPARAGGRSRLYSDDDLHRLRLIKRLVDERGVNVAGVGLALTLLDRLQEIAALAAGEGAAASRAAAERALDELGSGPVRRHERGEDVRAMMPGRPPRTRRSAR